MNDIDRTDGKYIHPGAKNVVEDIDEKITQAYINGYYKGYDDGKQYAFNHKYTQNEIKEMLGLLDE